MMVRTFRYSLSALVCAGLLITVHSRAAAAEPARAQDEPRLQITLSQLIDRVLTYSPGLQAKKRAYEAAKARVLAAWMPEDPEFGVDVEGQSNLLQFGSRDNLEYMASQTIPFPTTLLLRGQAAAKDAQAAYQQYKETERDIVWHVEQPYYELYLAQRTVESLEDIRSILQKLIRAAQARYESNQASQQDLLKAQIELSKADIELFSWREKAHVAEAHFSHLLDIPLHTSYTIVEHQSSSPLELSRDDLERLALKGRPELKMFEVGIQRAKLNRLMAATSWLPEVTGRWEARRFKGEDDIRDHDTFIGVTVPVWSFFKGFSGEWRGANKDVQAAEALYTEMKNEVLLAIHEAYSKIQSAQHAVRTYEELILPQARQQVEVALAAYEAGRTDVLALVDAQRTLKDTQIAYHTVRAQHELGLSDLRLAVGGEFVASDQHGGSQ